jgi:hypothetical protein
MTTEPTVVYKGRPNALVFAKPEPPPIKTRRRPLGLRPAPGDSDPSERDAPPGLAPVINLADYDRNHLDAPAPMEFVYECLNGAASMTQTSHQSLKAKIAEARNEISELKAALIEARHEVRELKLVQESLRISTRGESGRDGARGVPGRDGQQGPAGPAGPAGPRGEAAAKIATWIINEADFTATPIMSDGSNGPVLFLRALFEAYHNAATWMEDADWSRRRARPALRSRPRSRRRAGGERGLFTAANG